MKPVVLLVGQLRTVIAEVARSHDDLGVEFLGAHDLDELREQLHREPRIATVIVGGSLDDGIRGELIGIVAARRPDINIHVKNRASGAGGMAPFVRMVVQAECPREAATA